MFSVEILRKKSRYFQRSKVCTSSIAGVAILWASQLELATGAWGKTCFFSEPDVYPRHVYPQIRYPIGSFEEIRIRFFSSIGYFSESESFLNFRSELPCYLSLCRARLKSMPVLLCFQGKCPPTGRFNPICACCGCLCIDTKETKL